MYAVVVVAADVTIVIVLLLIGSSRRCGVRVRCAFVLLYGE